MTQDHQSHVTGQFGPRAQAYVESAVHATGADLDIVETIVRAAAPRRALDIGTGGGHVAYLLARHAQSVTAIDLSADMLAAVSATAKERGLANLETVRAPAENLPFADGDFDFAATRYSAHHWHDLTAGLREARRVLRAGATAVFADAFTPGVPLLDTHLQSIELLRDTSHVRNYTLGEWSAALAAAGFRIRSLATFRLRLEFASWIARMRTPDLNRDAIRALQRSAPADVRHHFAIEEDGSFLLDTMLIAADAA